VSSPESVEIEVDCNYGGRDGDRGVFFLSPKKGKKTGLRPDIIEAFKARGMSPQEGAPVRMIDRHATGDDTGRPLDMVVDGTLAEVRNECRCYAVYDWNTVAWIPSD
jgi:hypothetical protein